MFRDPGREMVFVFSSLDEPTLQTMIEYHQLIEFTMYCITLILRFILC